MNLDEHVLMNTTSNYIVPSGWQWRNSQKGITELDQCKIMFQHLYGGKQDGCHLLHLDNGHLSMSIIPTRGMSIYKGRCGDVDLGWQSPIKEIVHPNYVNLVDRQGFGFLDGFNEWFVRCGMVSNGAPYEGGTLHGRVANTPASFLKVTIEKTQPHAISVYGVVYERALYNEKLKLETWLTTLPGANWINVSDRITNLSAKQAEIEMLYHINYGIPFLEEGSQLVLPVDTMAPRDKGAQKGIDNWNTYPKPNIDAEEKVYFFKLHTNEAGETINLLKNKEGTKGIWQQYKQKSLPCFTLWKNSQALEDGYVTG
jgi:hypothetical protein